MRCSRAMVRQHTLVPCNDPVRHLGPQMRAMCWRAASVRPASRCRSRRNTAQRALRFSGCERSSGPATSTCAHACMHAFGALQVAQETRRSGPCGSAGATGRRGPPPAPARTCMHASGALQVAQEHGAAGLAVQRVRQVVGARDQHLCPCMHVIIACFGNLTVASLPACCPSS